MSVRLPGVLYAALQVCHPAPGALPEWLHRRAPRCATGTVVELPAEHQEQLADLVAQTWWECLQDGGTDPFTDAFAAACQEYLGIRSPGTPDNTAH